jgi:hypothetical protein
VLCGTTCRLVWFVFVGIGGPLGSSRRWRIGFSHMAPLWMRVTLNSIFYYTSFCTHPTVESWLPRIVVSEVVCFKGCISRCALKSSGVWEATHLFTSGLPSGVTLKGVFYNTFSCMHQTVFSWLPRVMSVHRCIEFHMTRSVMLIVDVLSHNQIYEEDAVLMGMKHPTYIIR